MNGTDDEHVKCCRIAVAVAYGDAVEAAYDKHLAKAGSTDERYAAYRAYVERVSSAWKDAPPTSPPELLLAPGRILSRHQPDPGRVPNRNTVGFRPVATIAVAPRIPTPGMVSIRQLTSLERYWDTTLAWGHRGNLILGLYFINHGTGTGR
jgi:hypothetical protein